MGCLLVWCCHLVLCLNFIVWLSGTPVKSMSVVVVSLTVGAVSANEVEIEGVGHTICTSMRVLRVLR